MAVVHAVAGFFIEFVKYGFDFAFITHKGFELFFRLHLKSFPRLNLGIAEVTFTMSNANDIDLIFAFNPVNNSVIPKQYFTNVVSFGFRYRATA